MNCTWCGTYIDEDDCCMYWELEDDEYFCSEDCINNHLKENDKPQINDEANN